MKMDSARLDCLKALDEFIEITERGMRSPVELPWDGEPEYDIWMWALHVLRREIAMGECNHIHDSTPLSIIEAFKDEMSLYAINYNPDFKYAYNAVDAFSRALSIC